MRADETVRADETGDGRERRTLKRVLIIFAIIEALVLAPVILHLIYR